MMLGPTVRAPVFLLTLMSVANGGCPGNWTLLMTRSSPSSGAYASSFARVGSPALATTSATVSPVLRSIVTTRLPASVTKSQGNAATTPLGPAQSFAPGEGGFPFPTPQG